MKFEGLQKGVKRRKATEWKEKLREKKDSKNTVRKFYVWRKIQKQYAKMLIVTCVPQLAEAKKREYETGSKTLTQYIHSELR